MGNHVAMRSKMPRRGHRAPCWLLRDVRTHQLPEVHGRARQLTSISAPGRQPLTRKMPRTTEGEMQGPDRPTCRRGFLPFPSSRILY